MKSSDCGAFHLPPPCGRPLVQNRERGKKRASISSCAIALSRNQTSTANATRDSMSALALLHRRELFRRGGTLVHCLPGVIGHAVDRLATLVLAHGNALGV